VSAASRRGLSAQAKLTAPATASRKVQSSTQAERIGGWLEKNGVGFGIMMSIGVAALAAVDARFTSAAADEKAEKVKTDIAAFKKEQETTIERVMAREREVLKAQADSLKTQAWAAYLLPTLTSVGAFGLGAFAVYSGKKV
jgi:hypothetical protein